MLKLFSADDHVVEHPRVWSDRMPAKYRDAAPHVVMGDDGSEYWLIEGERGPDINMAAPKRSLRDSKEPLEPRFDVPKTFEEMLPGCYDPKLRAEDMFDNGVVATVCFPSLPRFGGTLFTEFKDKDLADACVKAYNDFILEEWCPGGPPGMFVPMTICQLWDVDAAVKELSSCIERGIRALSFPENTVAFGLPSFFTGHWDPLWKLCEESETVVSMHLATAGTMEQFRSAPDAPNAVMITGAASSMSMLALTNLVFSPILPKFPNLKVILSESGIGWIPYAIAKADLVWHRYKGPQDLPAQSPSELWEQNFYVCQVEETVGLEFLSYIGAEKVLWELDYPHPDTVWPHAQRYAEGVYSAAHVSDEHIEMITHLNAEKLFRWKPAEMPKAHVR